MSSLLEVILAPLEKLSDWLEDYPLPIVILWIIGSTVIGHVILIFLVNMDDTGPREMVNVIRNELAIFFERDVITIITIIFKSFILGVMFNVVWIVFLLLIEDRFIIDLDHIGIYSVIILGAYFSVGIVGPLLDDSPMPDSSHYSNSETIQKNEGVKFDRLKEKLSYQVKREDYVAALVTFAEIRGLGVKLPASLDYFEAKTLMRVGRLDHAYKLFESYAAREGVSGKYYLQTITLMVELEATANQNM